MVPRFFQRFYTIDLVVATPHFVDPETNVENEQVIEDKIEEILNRARNEIQQTIRFGQVYGKIRVEFEDRFETNEFPPMLLTSPSES